MKFKVKNVGILSGGPLVAVMNYHDAQSLDLHVMDRLKIIRGRTIETVVLDISQDSNLIPRGCIGLFVEVM